MLTPAMMVLRLLGFGVNRKLRSYPLGFRSDLRDAWARCRCRSDRETRVPLEKTPIVGIGRKKLVLFSGECPECGVVFVAEGVEKDKR